MSNRLNSRSHRGRSAPTGQTLFAKSNGERKPPGGKGGGFWGVLR